MEFKGITFQCKELTDQDLFAKLPEDLQDLYEAVNGLVAYNGGLQIRSCTDSDSWHSLARYWTGDKALHKTYPNLLISDIPFAQDCVGDQFILREDAVWLLSTETGELIELEIDLDEFLETAIEDPVDFLAMEPLLHYMDMEGELTPGSLVHVVPGLSLDLPEDTVFHTDSLSIDERLLWLSKFYAEHSS